MRKLDLYQVGVQVPYPKRIESLAQITSVSRIYVTLDWVSMQDAPFSITSALPAQ